MPAHRWPRAAVPYRIHRIPRPPFKGRFQERLLATAGPRAPVNPPLHYTAEFIAERPGENGEACGA